MAFQQIRGSSYTEYYPKEASTAFSQGNIVTPDGSGAITNATSTSTLISGIIQKNVTSADSDYASTTEVPVLVPTDDSEFVVDVVTGTLTQAMIGTQVDLANATGIDVTASTHKQVTITGFISSSKAIVKINSNIVYTNAS